MGGGLMQLVAYGAQDIYLTGNPEITFFKVVYRRHTNFSIEVMEVPIDNARFGGECNTQILRNGDLASKIWMRVRLPDITSANLSYNADDAINGKVAWVRRLGYAMILTLKLDIGGTEIDKNLGLWMNIWYELTHTYDQERGMREKLGDVTEMTTLAPATATTSDIVIKGRQLYIPLQFWFCRNYGLSLPLIALQYHEVRIRTHYSELTRLVCWSGSAAPSMNTYQISDAAFMIDYVFLDSNERRRFAQVGHEYLIEQVQFTSDETITGSPASATISQQYKLTFNHPCKELVWALSVGAYNGEANRSSFSGGRGRFLCYSNTDSWTDALNYAALNLVTNSMIALYAAAVVVPSTYILVTPVAIPAGSSLGVRFTNITTPNGHVVNVNALINNTTAAPFPVSSQIGYFTTRAAGITASALYDTTSGFEFLDYIDEVSVIFDLTGAWVSTIRAGSIAVTEQYLTLRDVSIPVEDFTDRRQYTAGGINRWDVTVIQPGNFGLELDGRFNPVYQGKIQLNGHDRFLMREGAYFNYIQTEAHTRTPADGINVYCFGLHPEQHQPSGTANLSRIDTTQLILQFSDQLRNGITGVPILDYVTDSKLFIFAFSYNVLRIMSGMGGLAYSN